jgi:hypothetical protein
MIEFSNSTNYISQGISQAVQNFFVNRSESFDILVFGNETESLKKIVEKIVKEVKFPYKLMKVESNETKIELTQSAILFTSTANSFIHLEKIVKLYNEYPRDLNFLVYVDGENQLQDLYPTNRGRYNGKISLSAFFLRCNFILKHGNKVILETYDQYDRYPCKYGYAKKINSFDLETGKWIHSQFYVDKFSYFNGCEMIVGISDFEKEPYFKILIQEIASNLNFQCTFQNSSYAFKNPNFKKENDDYDFFIFAGSYRQIKTARKRVYEMILAEHGIFSLGFATHSFTTVDLIVVMSHPSPYSQFEKIFLPFQIEVWYFVLLTVIAGIVVIFVLKFLPKYMQRFTFGSRVTTPTLNLM